MARRKISITLTDEDRKQLETWIAADDTPKKVVLRCRTILLKADGMSDLEIAKQLRSTRQTCRLWRRRLLAQGLPGLWKVAPGSGRKPIEGLVDRVVEMTLSTKPEGRTRWTCQSLARELGVNHATIAKIWKKQGIKPPRY